MNDTIFAACIGVGGALIAGVLASISTIWLTNRKEKLIVEKNRQKNITILKSLLIDVYLYNFKEIIDLVPLLHKSIDNDNAHSYDVPHMGFNNVNLFNFIEKETILDILLNRNISIALFHDFLNLLEFNKIENAGIILEKYISEVMELENKYDNLINNSNDSKYQYELNKEYNHHVNIVKQAFKKKLDDYLDQCKITIENIEELVSLL